MTRGVVLAIPNISEGRHTALIERIAGTDTLLDIHSDVDHNRSVITYGGPAPEVLESVFGMIERAVFELDVRSHTGVHPRFGVVDVLPFIAYDADEDDLRRRVADLRWRIDQGPGIPTFPYGRASDDRRSLPDLRRWLRSARPITHPTAGVICVGVRDPLVAFNVNCLGSLDDAQAAAGELRTTPGIRALGFALRSRGEVQLSMNLIAIDEIGPARAFELAAAAARRHRLSVIDAEVAGLVPASTLRQFRRLPLRWPVRTIEDALDRDTIGS